MKALASPYVVYDFGALNVVGGVSLKVRKHLLILSQISGYHFNLMLF